MPQETRAFPAHMR